MDCLFLLVLNILFNLLLAQAVVKWNHWSHMFYSKHAVLGLDNLAAVVVIIDDDIFHFFLQVICINAPLECFRDRI